MKLILRFRLLASAFMVCIAAAVAVQGQTFNTLTSFDGTDGEYPFGTLVQGLNGNYYGATSNGGANYGTIFEITPAGTLTTLYSFCSQRPGCADGERPYAGLVQATNGKFYGTTQVGGHSGCVYGGCGTVFQITPTGKLTTLYTFCSQPSCSDGNNPYGVLVQATNGNLYGTTYYGGGSGAGTVFEISLEGKLTTLYSFCPQTGCFDGAFPWAGLVQASNGNFYGTTQLGGRDYDGTVFEITSEGKLTTLHSFCSQNYPTCTDGKYPVASLIQASNGNFYGTAEEGGINDSGTIFEITPTGKFTRLYNFCSQPGCTDGVYPYGSLVQATDGNFYGTTYKGGTNGYGTIFEITPAGTLTTLYSFAGTGYVEPLAGLVQATNGNFYGTTYNGGVSNLGTVFSLSVGLGPFVETLPESGKAGETIIILGNSLAQSTNVTFNGRVATFTVASNTEIKATVPIGATTGKVQVTTPSGTLTSNVVFRVR